MNGDEQLKEFCVGDVIADFRLISKLGEGNIGIVYRARKLKGDQDVALKVLKKEFIHNQEFIGKFLREARLAARLNHPNIVQAVDFGRSGDGGYFFAMELVEGVSLEDIRLKRGKLPLNELLPLMIQVAEALAYAWNTHQITHGDIKPDNILLCKDSGMIKLADLGLAQVSGSSDDGNIMATPMYVAPEIITHKRGDCGPRSDIYSFGVMLYELATGEPPFSGDLQELLHQHLVGITRSLRERCVLPDNSLSDFTSQMLEKDPQYRPESWNEVVSFLKEYRDRCYPESPSVPAEWADRSEEKSQPFRWKKSVIVAGCAACVLAAVGVACFFIAGGEKEPELPPDEIAAIVETPAQELPESPPPEDAEISAPEPVEPEKPIVPKTRRRNREIVRPVVIVPPPEEPVEPPKQNIPPPAPEDTAEEPPEIMPDIPKIAPVKPVVEVKEPQTPPEKKPEVHPVHQQPEFPFDEQRWRKQSIAAAYLVRNLPARFSVEWKMDAFKIIKEAYLLELQILEKNASQMQSISEFKEHVSNSAKWVRTGASTGRIWVSPRTSSGRIARAIGEGLCEVLENQGRIQPGSSEDFSHFFEFLVLKKCSSVSELRKNVFYNHCQGKREIFIRKIQSGYFVRFRR